MGRFSAIARMAILLVFALALGSVVTFGQQVTGTILGRVTDSSDSVVPGATIQIQNPATGFSRTDTADTDGRYYDANLPLGTYSVTVTKQGFQTLVRNGIELTVGSQVTLNAELVVGNVQQHVEVTGEAPQIETSNATISGLVSQDQLRDLPLNGRSIDQLALLSPGIFANRATSANTTVGLGLHLSVNGARQDWNLYLLDGTVVNDVLSGRSSATGEALGVEGILEFRVLTHGANAEYGRTAGGIISEVTRSGTNEFHGSAYEFVRNTIFNAQNFFIQNASASTYKRNQFGGAAGGPILKNKLFFFANYEGLRSRVTIPETPTVPTAASIASAPAGSPMIPYLALYPSCGPGSHDNGDGTCNVTINFSEPAREDYTMVRMDYKISDKDSFFARYVYDPSSISTPDPIPTSVLTITGDDRLLGMSETHIFSPTTLNEFRFAVNRTNPSQFSYPVPPINPALSFVPGQAFGSIGLSTTTSGAASLTSLGTNKSPYEIFEQNLIIESDSVTMVRGAHTIKFGVDVEREQTNMVVGNPSSGSFTFSSLANLLAGIPSQYSQSAFSATSSPQRGYRRTLFGVFGQDDIRLRPNLTLNLGLRYEFFTNVSEVQGRSAALINPTDPANTIGPPFLSPKLNFAPRIGLAWDPTGSGKTSIRLGGGVYDNQIAGRTWIANAANNSNFLATYVVNNPPFPNGLGGTVGLGALQNEQVQYYAKEPVVYQWNLEVQRQLMPSLSLRVGYVGSRGIHLPAQIEEDTNIPAGITNGIPFYPTSGAVPINTNFSTMSTTVTGATSNFHALQVLLQKTVSAGLSFQASYSYSHALSEADQIVSGQTSSGPGTVMDPSNLTQDYGNSAFDQRHTLTMNGAYQMPWDHMLTNGVERAFLGGWSVNGIFTYGTGLPFTILDGFNDSNNGDSTNSDRPNLNPGFSPNPTSGVTAGCGSIPAGQQLHTATRWFDPCAFAPALSATSFLSGTYGNLARNSVTGPSLSDIDFTIVKMTNITERTKLEFRAECFNLMNHPNLGLPKTAIASKPSTADTIKYSGSAGQITNTALDNRELQLGMKFIF